MFSKFMEFFFTLKYIKIWIWQYKRTIFLKYTQHKKSLEFVFVLLFKIKSSRQTNEKTSSSVLCTFLWSRHRDTALHPGSHWGPQPPTSPACRGPGMPTGCWVAEALLCVKTQSCSCTAELQTHLQGFTRLVTKCPIVASRHRNSSKAAALTHSLMLFVEENCHLHRKLQFLHMWVWNLNKLVLFWKHFITA